MEPTNPRKELNQFIQDDDGLGPIKSVPPELIGIILSNVSESDLQHTSEVNRVWNKETISFVKNEFSALVSKLISTLVSKFGDQYGDQKKELEDVLKGTIVLDFINLNEVKNSISGFVKKIADILITINEKDLGELEKSIYKEISSALTKKIFDLTEIYQKIAKAAKMDVWDQSNVLRDAAIDLAKFGYFDKAIDVADMITEIGSVERREATEEIYELVGQSGQIAKAMQVGKDLFSFDEEDIDQVFESISYMPDSDWKKSSSLHFTCKTLANRGEIDRAKEVASMIPDEATKTYTLNYIRDKQ